MTPLPWTPGTHHPDEVFSVEDHQRVADCSANRRGDEENESNAAYLVRCVNNHEALVEAALAAMTAVEAPNLSDGTGAGTDQIHRAFHQLRQIIAQVRP